MGTAIGSLLEKEKIQLEQLKGNVMGVDSHNIIYQFLSSIRGGDGSLLMDSSGNVTSHLAGLLYRTTSLVEKGMKPVFVFDGKPHRLKAETLRKRTELRTDAMRRHEDAVQKGDLEEAKKMGSRALKLTGEMVDGAKELISLMGFPVIDAPCEGEAQIAHMCAKGELFGAISQDYDTLLFGAPRVFRNITISGKKKAPGKNFYIESSPEKIELRKNLDTLGIDRRKLVWVGMLIGTDFNEKFPNVGPKTALKLVRENRGFDEIIEKTGFFPPFDYREIEAIFLEPEKTDDYSIEFSEPDMNGVVEFLCKKHDFSEERVLSALGKLSEKKDENEKQQSISKWFK